MLDYESPLGDVVTTDKFTDSIVDATYQRNSRTQEKSVKNEIKNR